MSLLLRTDSYAYILNFRSAPSSLSALLPTLNADSKDPGFSVLMILFKMLGVSDHQVFFLIIAAFQMLCISHTFRKYSCHYRFCIFLFVVSTDYLSWMFNGMRQFIAVSMLFGAFDLIVQRRYKTFAVLVLLAAQIHGSAILMLPLLYIMQGPALNRKTILMIAATVLLIPIIDRFTPILNDLLADTQYSGTMTDGEIGKMRVLTLIMAFNTALSFPLSAFSSMAIAHERYLFRKIMDIVSTAAAPMANLVALYLGYASVGMALAGTVVQLLLAPISIGYCFRELKLRPRFVRMPRGLIREMLGFSVFVFLGTLVDMLFWATDKVILGMLAGTAAVAVYNVGGTFNTIVIGLSTSISGILVPRITGMVVNQTPKSEWTNLFIRVGRLQFLIIGLIISGFSVFGRPFLILWAGPEYAGAFWVAVLTLFPLCVPLIQNTGLCIITAQNKHQFRSVVYLIIAIVNVVSTYLVVPRFGYIGAAVCSCAAYVVGQGFVMNIYYYKVTGLDIPLFWKNILKMAVIPGIQMAAGLFLAERIPLTNWFTFFAGVAVYSIVYALLMYFLVMNDYEKDILRKPLMKLFRR